MPPATAFDVEKIGLLLNSTARTWRTKLDQRLKPLGLTQGKWTTLVHLAGADAALTQRELAARVGIEEPTLAGILDRLQSDGWIERAGSPNDRRCKTVHLRRNSKTILDQIFAAAQTLRHELIDDIPAADLQICMRVLARMREKAENVSADSPRSRAKPNGANSRSRNRRR